MDPNIPEMKDAAGRPLPLGVCKVCGYVMDAATETKGNGRPSPGDFSLCLKCGELYVFDESMQIVEPTIAQLTVVPIDVAAEIRRAQRLIRKERVLD
jgi:hypothetical protein